MEQSECQVPLLQNKIQKRIKQSGSPAQMPEIQGLALFTHFCGKLVFLLMKSEIQGISLYSLHIYLQVLRT